MEEKELTGHESLELINKMIGTAKYNFYENGSGTIMWGIANFLCAIIQYIQIQTHFLPMSYNPWYLLLIVLVITVLQNRKIRKQRKVRTYSGDALSHIWTAFAIAIFLLNGFAWNVVIDNYPPILLLLFGMPTYATGRIIGSTPFVAGGVIFWVCCIAASFVQPENGLLFIAFSSLTGWLIPGLLLRNRYRKENNV